MKNRIKNGVVSVQSSRPYQEDRYSIKCNLDQGKYFYAGIFDGHGGNEAAEYSATHLHLHIEKFLALNNSPLEALKLSFISTDKEIHKLKIQSGTTATVVIVKNNHVFLANVGDSTIVIKRSNSPAKKLTKDHHLADPQELENYRSSKWFSEKNRLISQGKIKGFKLIAISRSLGDMFFEDAISPVPDVSEIEFDKGDKLILATDGLWNYINLTKLDDFIKNNYDLQIITELLVQEALNNKSSDNITTIVLTY